MSILEGGGKTPWLSPKEFHAMGFNMLLYPTSILFRVARGIERAAEDLKNGKQMPKKDAVDLHGFEKIVELAFWAEIEKKFS